MGLLDILNGIQNAPQGQRQPGGKSGGGGMSPIMMALLGLLAYKAVKGGGLGNILGGGQAPAGAGKATPPPPSGNMQAGAPAGGLADILGDLLGGQAGNQARKAAPGATAGGLDDLLRSGLGGLLGGAAGGSVLSGALGSILKDLQNSGQGQVAQSWIGKGANQEIAPDDLGEALGADTLDALARQTGLSRAALLDGLSHNLPGFIDQLTPDGRLPTEDEASRML
jgi:uncharacterized protein YidB (DUF937 family)